MRYIPRYSSAVKYCHFFFQNNKSLVFPDHIRSPLPFPTPNCLASNPSYPKISHPVKNSIIGTIYFLIFNKIIAILFFFFERDGTVILSYKLFNFIFITRLNTSNLSTPLNASSKFIYWKNFCLNSAYNFFLKP